MTYIRTTDPMLVEGVNKFGRNQDVDIATAPADVTDIGGIYVPPTQERIHNIKSTSIEDKGILESSGTATGGSLTTIIDTGATFITDGVTTGNVFVNDTIQDHSIVMTIDSEIQLTLKVMHHSEPNNSGDSYRVISSGGTGASVVHISTALNGDHNELKEFVILNGTTDVATTNSYFRINSAHIHGAGSNGTNVGDITLTAVIDTTVTAKIMANMGRTLMAFYTVGAGKILKLTNYYATLNKAGVVKDAQISLSLRIRLYGDYSDGEEVIHVTGGAVNGGRMSHEFKPYFTIGQMTDIWIRVESVTDDNTDVSAGFDAILENI